MTLRSHVVLTSFAVALSALPSQAQAESFTTAEVAALFQDAGIPQDCAWKIDVAPGKTDLNPTVTFRFPNDSDLVIQYMTRRHHDEGYAGFCFRSDLTIQCENIYTYRSGLFSSKCRKSVLTIQLDPSGRFLRSANAKLYKSDAAIGLIGLGGCQERMKDATARPAQLDISCGLN